MRTNLKRWHRMTRRKRRNFRWRLKVARVSIERMYVQVESSK